MGRKRDQDQFNLSYDDIAKLREIAIEKDLSIDEVLHRAIIDAHYMLDIHRRKGEILIKWQKDDGAIYKLIPSLWI